MKFAALLTDPSKAFDCIDHSLLLAKRYWYGESHTSFKLIFSYFENRTQHTNIINSLSDSSKID